MVAHLLEHWWLSIIIKRELREKFVLKNYLFIARKNDEEIVEGPNRFLVYVRKGDGCGRKFNSIINLEILQHVSKNYSNFIFFIIKKIEFNGADDDDYLSILQNHHHHSENWLW